VLQYKGVVQADQAQVDTARLNLNYCYIKAPLTGRVGLRLVDPGNYISVGDSNGIAVITQMKPITVIFTLPEDALPRVLQRLRQKAELPVTAYDRGMKNVLATGTVTTIDNQIDTTTGTVKLRAEFPNTDETLFPNQFVNIALLVDTVHDALVLPVAAVQHGAPGTFVYVVNADNTVAVRPVTVGVQSGERVAVTSGVQLGDTIVTDGADRLTEGATVVPPGQDNAPGAAAPGKDSQQVKQGDTAPQPATDAGRKDGHRVRGEGRHRRDGGAGRVHPDGQSGGGSPAGGPAPGGQ
jgi:multidrug efflux system membrane fusion protein